MDTGSPQDPEQADPAAAPPPEPPSGVPPPPPADGWTTGPVPTIGMTPDAAQAAPKSRRTLWIVCGVVLAVLILGIVLVTMLGGKSVSVPDQIDGVSRITSGPLSAVMDKQVNGSGLNGTHAVGALYGTPAQPEFLFVAAEGSESNDEDRAALQQAASSMASGGQLGLDTSRIDQQAVNGVTYNCAPITGGGLSGSACLWNDGDTLGMVLWFADRGSPVEFATKVHDAVVG